MKNLIYNRSPPNPYLQKIDTKLFRIYSVLDSNLLTNVYSYLPIRIELNKLNYDLSYSLFETWWYPIYHSEESYNGSL